MERRNGLVVATLLLLGTACAHRGGRSAPALVEAKARLMRADYRADLAELARVRDTVLPGLDGSSAGAGHLVAYWRGFASWRIAINGISRALPPAEVRASLERALAEMDAAIALEEHFADGHAAAASVAGWLAALRQDEPAASRALVERARRHLARAAALEPENPRVLWVEAAPYLFVPEGRGGDRARAIGLYRRMVEVSRAADPGSPVPDWGLPEAHMSLAFAQLQLAGPDLELAEREAREALRLQPEWHYVKAVLLPQIAPAREPTKGPVGSR